MSNSGVHAAHCCAKHGCKYCDHDCPVISGEVKQDHPCEECDIEARRVDLAMRKAVELGVMADTPENRTAMQSIIYEADIGTL